MDLQIFFSRMRNLHDELASHKHNIGLLSEQLEQSKTLFHMTNGRIQEMSNTISEIQKMNDAEIESNRLALEEEQKRAIEAQSQADFLDDFNPSGANNGQTNSEVEEQVA